MRASIAAGLNGVGYLFDDPKIREVFAPDPLWENTCPRTPSVVGLARGVGVAIL
jgi:hypothetical protein